MMYNIFKNWELQVQPLSDWILLWVFSSKLFVCLTDGSPWLWSAAVLVCYESTPGSRQERFLPSLIFGTCSFWLLQYVKLKTEMKFFDFFVVFFFYLCLSKVLERRVGPCAYKHTPHRHTHTPPSPCFQVLAVTLDGPPRLQVPEFQTSAFWKRGEKKIPVRFGSVNISMSKVLCNILI